MFKSKGIEITILSGIPILGILVGAMFLNGVSISENVLAVKMENKSGMIMENKSGYGCISNYTKYA